MSVEVSGSFNAGGNILPCTIVKRDSTADEQVLQAGSGDTPYGITDGWTRNAPALGLDDGYHAISGETAKVFMPGHKGCKLRLGGTVSNGDFIKPDTSGYGVKTTSDGDKYIAIARMAGVADQVIAVDVLYGEKAS